MRESARLCPLGRAAARTRRVTHSRRGKKPFRARGITLGEGGTAAATRRAVPPGPAALPGRYFFRPYLAVKLALPRLFALVAKPIIAGEASGGTSSRSTLSACTVNT